MKKIASLYRFSSTAASQRIILPKLQEKETRTANALMIQACRIKFLLLGKILVKYFSRRFLEIAHSILPKIRLHDGLR